MRSCPDMGCRSEGQQQSDCHGNKKMEEDYTNNEVEVESKDGEIITPIHPYEYELLHFKPNDWQLEEKEPQIYLSLEDSKYTMVDSKLLFDEMMIKLTEVKEVAIDLEHHYYRSFQGIVCLVQISTRTEDFIIDSLVLKKELNQLNEICTNTNVLKVLHGSERDIRWLQQDFGVYMINMFDTQQAAKVLQEEGIALAHILKKYCNVHVNKVHQLADWRVRPLPDDMVQYAREDAHYLLYIHDIYRNLLLKCGDESKKLSDVYTASTAVCGMLHKDQVFRPDSYLACYKKTKGELNVQQLECFRLLYEWRHKISQEKNESTGYTLPNRIMLKISQDLPRDPQGIISCCHPLPPLVHNHIEDVHKLVRQAIKNVPVVPEEPAQSKKTTSKAEDIVTHVHPYEYELFHFKPNDWQLEEKEPRMYLSLENSKCTMVDSKLLFDEMMVKLNELKEVAIDLEHHSYRSFQGMVCLVQISTRTEDFIIDSLLLSEELKRLNEICTDTNILKVLHGSECDIEWLQRYFGVYMINMFDTQQAAKVLQEEGIALAHILKKYCNVNVNKVHQLADWRVRPLPDEMVKYAREDAHYLLYIHDIYRNLLLKGKNKSKTLLDVYTASTAVCGIVLKDQVFQPDSYLACYKKTKGKLNIQQLECFRLLYEWRHNISLEKDESTGYTLPNKMMMKICQDLPSKPQGIISCCHPISPLVHEHIEDVHKLVLQAIKNVPEVPEEPMESKTAANRSAKEQEERLLAIKMVNELFLSQARKHPEAYATLKLKKVEKDVDT